MRVWRLTEETILEKVAGSFASLVTGVGASVNYSKSRMIIIDCEVSVPKVATVVKWIRHSHKTYFRKVARNEGGEPG